MRRLTSTDPDFTAQLDKLLAFETVNDKELLNTVDDIIAQVRKDGDKAVLTLTQQFDQHPATQMSELELSQDELKQAFEQLESDVKDALKTAASP